MPLVLYIILLLLFSAAASGCQSPASYHREADLAARDIINKKQEASIKKTEPLNIERPADILRRRLLEGKDLPYAGPESLGTDQLRPVAHWPESPFEKSDERTVSQSDAISEIPLKLSLSRALQVAARNSFLYQTKKEDVFIAALDLDLERDAFRNTFLGQVSSLLSTDGSGDRRVSGLDNTAAGEWRRKFQSGAELTAALAVDLANLLTMGGASSLGLTFDASMSIPLLRGSGKHIVREPLMQAERNVVYAIYGFERFKRTFSVNIASDYLAVLQQMDEVKNAEENYRSLIASARRSRRLADAGRLPEIQVDQALQNELRARNRWIVSKEQLKNLTDAFKVLIGLPPDACIELDRMELERMRSHGEEMIKRIAAEDRNGSIIATPPADAPIELEPTTFEDAGPLEMDSRQAIILALDNRLDLRVAMGVVYDAQRKVVVSADALGPEMTLFGSASVGERRNVDTADSSNARLHFDKGYYTALLTIDLPFERTAERNAYRESFIDLERATGGVQTLEDEIKLSIQRSLRTLQASRESLKIQARSVVVAQKRVKSINLFLEAGRAQVRDLLEAQEALFQAQNALTGAVINYRVAELELQRDMGLLEVDEQGLWKEFSPGETHYGRSQS